MAHLTGSGEVIKSELENPTRLQKMGVCTLCLFSFLLLYFLMSGPLVWLEDKMKFRPFTKSVQVVYAPLVLISKSNVKPAAMMVKAYIQIFK